MKKYEPSSGFYQATFCNDLAVYFFVITPDSAFCHGDSRNSEVAYFRQKKLKFGPVNLWNFPKQTKDFMNDWIKWNGGPCPVQADEIVRIKYIDGVITNAYASDLCWENNGNAADIAFYRVITSGFQQEESKNTLDSLLKERGNRYGKFQGHAQIAQDLKGTIREAAILRNSDLSYDQEEALEMICHKIARIINGDPDYIDNWIDIAGYAKLVADRLNGDE